MKYAVPAVAEGAMLQRVLPSRLTLSCAAPDAVAGPSELDCVVIVVVPVGCTPRS